MAFKQTSFQFGSKFVLFWSKKRLWSKFHNCLLDLIAFKTSPPLLFKPLNFLIDFFVCFNLIMIIIVQICSAEFLCCFVIQPRKCQIRWETLPALPFVCSKPSSSSSSSSSPSSLSSTFGESFPKLTFVDCLLSNLCKDNHRTIKKINPLSHHHHHQKHLLHRIDEGYAIINIVIVICVN